MNKLKELREKANFTKKEVASKLGITPTGYAYWENGRNEIDFSNLKKIAELYHVSIDYLLDNEKEETDEEITDYFCHVLPQNAVDFWDEKGEFVRFKLSPEDWQTAFKMLESLAIDKAGKKYWEKQPQNQENPLKIK